MFTNMDMLRASHPKISDFIDTVRLVEKKPQTATLSDDFIEKSRNRIDSYMQALLDEERFKQVIAKQIEENQNLAESRKIETVIREYADFCFERALKNESTDWHKSQTTEYRLNEVEGCFRGLYSEPHELALAVNMTVTSALSPIYKEHKEHSVYSAEF